MEGTLEQLLNTTHMPLSGKGKIVGLITFMFSAEVTHNQKAPKGKEPGVEKSFSEIYTSHLPGKKKETLNG